MVFDVLHDTILKTAKNRLFLCYFLQGVFSFIFLNNQEERVMQLLIRRNQKTGTFGKAKYSLYVRAQLTPEEDKLIKKNNLTNELLYHYEAAVGTGGGVKGVVTFLMRDTKLTVAKLIEGTEMICDNVAQLLGVEDEVKQAALTLKSYLDASATFGGEEVIDMDKLLKDSSGKG